MRLVFAVHRYSDYHADCKKYAIVSYYRGNSGLTIRHKSGFLTRESANKWLSENHEMLKETVKR